MATGSPRTLSGWAGLAAALALLAWALDRALPPPGVEGLDYTVEVLDAAGEPLRLFTTEDGYWRLPSAGRPVDPQFLRLLLAYEDRRFYHHSGVDPLALGRAAWQALTQGRVISGGSTLSMQAARLLEPRPRTLTAKLQQMLRAWQLERRLEKQQILDLYLDLAPYGGNLQGVRAASRFYFGKEPGFLGLAEAALLVALPQSPERRRPDRHPQAAREARDQVLQRLAAAGVISPAEAARAMAEPVPRGRRPTPFFAPHLADRLRAERPGERVLHSSIDGRLQRRLEALASRHQRRLGDGLTLAALVIEHGAAAVRAYLGSGEYFAQTFPGQIDMLRAVRSPGSSLKPFIYGLGFDAGLIHPETLIEDRPGPVSGYAPGNFDRRYLGEIRVRQALVQSRNLPAVRLLDRLGPEPFARRLEQAGVRLRLPQAVERPGLPIALGGVGLTLEELGGLYAALAEGGRYRAPGLWAQGPAEPELALLSPAAAWYLTDILAEVPLPAGFAPGPRRLAFKTGTSYGFRDAWCLGYGARYTVAVWVGRPDGGYTPGLSGLGTAAPVLLEVFDLLADPGIESLLQARPPGVLLAGVGALPAVLQRFGDPGPRRTGPTSAGSGPRIRYPPAGSLVELEARPEARILVEAAGGQAPYYWLLDGRYLTSSQERPRLAWRPSGNGPVSLTLIDHRGRSDRVEFEVRSLAE